MPDKGGGAATGAYPAAVAQRIDRAVEAARAGGESVIAEVCAEVKELTDGYPAPGLPVG
ncbi:hypothetical protein OOK13_12630 [Streptomyces sp. NBC_00378]|uniref:hypothetical protein n=1 Tax=unclassified Streptomyces TaxID=2593676 RepID=UPI00225265E0|nr:MULTISPECIES: hypothetical protein [unclassified Streptomyces]MCX5109362.1 hypothetical protein [Streptomyces sp. NBC_00378]